MYIHTYTTPTYYIHQLLHFTFEQWNKITADVLKTKRQNIYLTHDPSKGIPGERDREREIYLHIRRYSNNGLVVIDVFRDA